MMHLEEGDKHSFWADSLPAGLSVLRQFDKFVLVAWVIFIIGYLVGFAYFYNDYDTYSLLTYIGMPCALIGFIYVLYRRNIAALMLVIVACVFLYIFTKEILWVLLIAYLFMGAIGVSCIVDAIQRAVFYWCVGHVRYVNVKDHLGMADKMCSFMFNVPPDLDTRNLTINPKKTGTKFPIREMGSTIMLSMIVGMFFWIYLSMNPVFMDSDKLSGDIPMFLFGLVLYVPILTMPFSVFKTLDVKIATNYRDFRLYNGIVATLQRMAVPIVAALLYVLVAMNEQDPLEVLAFIALSAVAILVVVLLTSAVYFYSMESTASADISKKWKLFIPVPLMMSLRNEENIVKKEYAGTPRRDESDMSEISLTARK